MSRGRLSGVVLLTIGLAGLHAPASAGAREDVTIRAERDDRRATVHKLVNRGAKTVRVKVELKVECTSVSTTRKPTTREYWVAAGESVELGKTQASSSCRRDYRVTTARYP